MQYTQRKLQRSVTEMRSVSSGRPSLSCSGSTWTGYPGGASSQPAFEQVAVVCSWRRAQTTATRLKPGCGLQPAFKQVAVVCSARAAPTTANQAEAWLRLATCFQAGCRRLLPTSSTDDRNP